MPLSRRALLQLTGTAAGGLALSQLAQAPARAAKPMTAELKRDLMVCTPPGDVLEALMARNARFSQTWQRLVKEPTPAARMQLKTDIFDEGCQIDPMALEQGQRPWVALLSCADARVAPEYVFASGSGELFQVRCAGNTAFDDAIASLEYAVAVLKVPLIMVLGHSSCGAVKAARGSEPLTPLLEQLVKPIRASLQPGDDLSQAIKGNARFAAAQITQRSAVLRQAQESGQVKIVQGFFDLATGRVELLKPLAGAS